MNLRKILFIFVFLFLALGSFAQTKKIKVEKEKEKPKPNKTLLSIDLAFGEKVFGKTTPAQFKAIDTLGTDWPVKFISTGFTGYRMYVNPRGGGYMKMLFNFIYPQNIKTDSITNQLQGFFYNWGLGLGLRTPKKNLGIIMYAGFNTGVLRLVTANGIQYNPFFAPSVSLQPKLALGPVFISVIINCDYDVSNPAWKSFRTMEPWKFSKALNQTSLAVIATVDYRLSH